LHLVRIELFEPALLQHKKTGLGDALVTFLVTQTIWTIVGGRFVGSSGEIGYADALCAPLDPTNRPIMIDIGLGTGTAVTKGLPDQRNLHHRQLF
jgi:hypothetical protein